MDSIIAIRVTLESSEQRYFLTWGDLGPHRPWPGDIERTVLADSLRWDLGGVPVDARKCDSLQEASGERYFFECLTSMQGQMPRTARSFAPWADKMTAAVERGEQLYYCGRPKGPDVPNDPSARHGFRLEWSAADSDVVVGSCDLEGVTAEQVCVVLGETDVDKVMCLVFSVDGPALVELIGSTDISVDTDRFSYYLSAWAEPGFRTPRGYFPAP